MRVTTDGRETAGSRQYASIAPLDAPQIEGDTIVDDNPVWSTIVWNDPINLMSYVTWVFMTHFGYDRTHAEVLMWQVHNDGKSTVSQGSRERMEADVAALHSFGLWATLEQGG